MTILVYPAALGLQKRLYLTTHCVARLQAAVVVMIRAMEHVVDLSKIAIQPFMLA